LGTVRFAEQLEGVAADLFVNHPQQFGYHILVYILPERMKIVPVEPLETVHGKIRFSEIEVNDRQHRLPCGGEDGTKDSVNFRLAGGMREQEIETTSLSYLSGCIAASPDERFAHKTGGKLLLFVQRKEV